MLLLLAGFGPPPGDAPSDPNDAVEETEEAPAEKDRSECPPVIRGIRSGVDSHMTDRYEVLHHSQVTIRERTEPAYPEAGKGYGNVRCVLRVCIDKTGVPDRVEVDRCPEVFWAPTRDAILQWRWDPPMKGRRNVKAQTVLAVVFREPRDE